MSDDDRDDHLEDNLEHNLEPNLEDEVAGKVADKVVDKVVDKHESRQDNVRNDSETILMALDQISQTIDVMNSVVGRLRHFVEEKETTRDAELREAMRPGRILH